MARIKINLPATFPFQCKIPVRITDVNYGGHVGNDAILSIIHEARMQFLQQAGYSETQFDTTGLIMADVAIEFKSELFYPEIIIASVAVHEVTNIGFEVVYLLEKEEDGKLVTVARAKTRMICYDYQGKKIVAVPEGSLLKLGLAV